jgi:hypothetical protein
VAVVEFTVVDANEAAGALEVLLVRNGEQPAARKQSDREDRVAQPAAPAESQPLLQARGAPARRGELLAMYVELTDQQRLSTALAELERRGMQPRIATAVDPERVEIADFASPEPDLPSRAREARDGAPSPVTLARAVAQSKARLGDDRSAGRDASSDPDRAESTPQAAATTPDVQAEALDGARDPAVPRGRLEQAEAQAVTFRMRFRTDQKSLDAISQPGGRGGTRRFTAGRDQLPRADRPDAARQELAQSGLGGRVASGGPLRVIFVFRQSP